MIKKYIYYSSENLKVGDLVCPEEGVIAVVYKEEKSFVDERRYIVLSNKCCNEFTSQDIFYMKFETHYSAKFIKIDFTLGKEK